MIRPLAWLHAKTVWQEQHARLVAVGVDPVVIERLRTRDASHRHAAEELAKFGIQSHHLDEFADAVVRRHRSRPVSLEQAAMDLGYLVANFGPAHSPLALNYVAEFFRRQYEPTTDEETRPMTTNTITRCDNPTCENTRPDPYSRRMCDEPWLDVEEPGVGSQDFCSRRCVAEWALGRPLTSDEVTR